MSASSTPPADRSRKAVKAVLQALAEPGRQVAIAAAMGVSESTISRLKNDHLESFALLLAHAGLKVVPVDRVCVDAQTFEAVSRIAAKAMADQDVARKLMWEDE